MTPPPDLQAARAAAELLLTVPETDLGQAYLHGRGYPTEWGHTQMVCRYILATIPADHDQPITEQWLREVWGWKWSGKITETKLAYGHYAATLRDGAWWLSWGNNGETWPRGITTRYQFAQLCQSLGVTPKTKTKEV